MLPTHADVGKPMRQSNENKNPLVPWAVAKKAIEKVDSALAEQLDKYRGMQLASQQTAMSNYIVDYPYGAPIVANGTPVFPDNSIAMDAFIVSGGLPIGVILENSCEIFEFVAGEKSSIEAPDTILMSGELIGLFETMDWIVGVLNPIPATWNIRSGVSSIYSSITFNTEGNQNRLSKHFGEYIDLTAFKKAKTFVDQLKFLSTYEQLRRSWTTKILYFSSEWIAPLRDTNCNSEAIKLRDMLLSRAWRNIQRLLYRDASSLQKRLHADSRGDFAEDAGALIKRVRDVVEGRQPCYVPMTTDSPLGPFGEITKILDIVTEERWVLVPTYLPSGGTGYMKVDHVAPSLIYTKKFGGIKARILDAIGNLRSAAERELREKPSSRELDPYINLLGKIMFQSPGMSNDGPQSYYKIHLGNNLSQVTPVETSKDEFYDPLFSPLPADKSTFFRSSLRIEV